MPLNCAEVGRQNRRLRLRDFCPTLINPTTAKMSVYGSLRSPYLICIKTPYLQKWGVWVNEFSLLVGQLFIFLSPLQPFYFYASSNFPRIHCG